MFTKEELNALSVMLRRANITGQEAMPIALLQQKIENLLSEEPKKNEPNTKK